MEANIEQNIANNIVTLRKEKKLKQSDLAEKIGYSDKTISRWENGSTIPDIVSLCVLADFFGVTLEDLTKEDALSKSYLENKQRQKEDKINDIVMLSLSIIAIWLITVVLFVGVQVIKLKSIWQLFVVAVPISAFIAYKFNRKHDKIRWLSLSLLSLLVWGITTSIYLLFIDFNVWQLFLIPIPIEAMIIIYTLFDKRVK